MKRVKIQYMKPLPPNTKNVTRASRWGNPFKLKRHGGQFSLTQSLYLYEAWINNRLLENPDFLKPLEGYNLGCFCKLNSPCHADILLKKIEEIAQNTDLTTKEE